MGKVIIKVVVSEPDDMCRKYLSVSTLIRRMNINSGNSAAISDTGHCPVDII